MTDVSTLGVDTASAEAPPPPSGRIATGLAIVTTGGFFGMLGFLACHDVPASSRDLVNIMLGTLASGWTAIVGYYFGSSIGHQRSTELLNVLASRSPPPT